MRLLLMVAAVLMILGFVGFFLPSIGIAMPIKDGIAIGLWFLILKIVGWGFRW